MAWIPIVSNLLLGLLVFGLSASVDVAAFKEKLEKKYNVSSLSFLLEFLMIFCFAAGKYCVFSDCSLIKHNLSTGMVF
jgi:predicted Na+-dependent transporter